MTHRLRTAVLAVLAALVFAAPAVRAWQEELASPTLRISWDEFKKLYDANKAVVIDVRDSVSYQTGHIPGARNIPLTEIEKQARALKKLTKPIVLYCA